MQTCFEILGVSPSATQKELKRAYFSQVRIHSPEKDPDAFKKIRTAYEQATEALEMDLPVFPTSDNPKEFEYEKSLLFALENREFENYYSKLVARVKEIIVGVISAAPDAYRVEVCIGTPLEKHS